MTSLLFKSSYRLSTSRPQIIALCMKTEFLSKTVCKQCRSPLHKLATAPDKVDSSSSSENSSVVERPPVTGNPSADKALYALSGGRINVWMQKYENLVGLDEVKEAQNNVLQAEQLFRSAQADRRLRQTQLTAIHGKLKDLHAAIDKVQRGDERYLALLTDEYEIMKEEKKLIGELSGTEQLEREYFSALSSAVRESHEKERTRAERTKYWSVMGSIIGAAIGIIGTSINNYLRMRELKGLVKESTVGGIELKGVVAQLSDTMTSQYNQLQTFVAELKLLVVPGSVSVAPTRLTPVGQSAAVSSEQLQSQTHEILDFVKKQEMTLDKEMNEIKKLFALQRASSKEGESGMVVYVGPEMEEMLHKTEESLEWKIKSHALMTAAVLYGAGLCTLYVLFRLGSN